MVESEIPVVRFGGDKAKPDTLYQGMQPLTPADIVETVVWCA